MSWDEPLFYDYADSIRMAYTPRAFSSNFDFYQVFGKSAEDHKIYGPAYLLLSRPLQQGIQAIMRTDMASAWHLTNFFIFQIGLFGFYIFLLRWLEPWPAVSATAFFAWQPVIWGHAFINPKDIPFMVLFLLSLTFGLKYIDQIHIPLRKSWKILVLSGITLGLASATRVIGPMAGAFVFIYFMLKKSWKSFHGIIFYGMIAIVTMYIFWPYLWAQPVARLLEVLKHMSNNPTELAVLFNGQIFHANDMPRRYLPQMLLTTLTEPTWVLFILGCILTIRESLKKRMDWQAPLVTAGIFFFMLGYITYLKPSVYDGFRHFLFIIPPIFFITGIFIQWMWKKLHPAIFTGIMTILLLPGLFGIFHLHPYEYTYYNRFAGGVGGAFRTFETDYWLTCYKEAVEWAGEQAPNTTLHIQREFLLADYYSHGQNLKNLANENEADIKTGDLLLFSTRGDLDIRSIYRKLPVEHIIGRDNAEFCIIKRKD